METAPQLLQRLLQENNLTLTLTPLKVRNLTDGGFVIDPSQLQVDFTIKPETINLDEQKAAETPTNTHE